jgi:light-regulated signal transduction histidine kinase (bacteriophytochrome)
VNDSPLTQQLQELERENDAMRRALAIVSHELKTPLTSIVAFCDLLLSNRNNQLKSREMDQLTSICRKTGRLTEIIEDFGQVIIWAVRAVSLLPGPASIRLN